MKVNIEEVSKLERTMTVEVPKNEVERVLTKLYQHIQKSANVKGFRKGKVPINTVRKMYSEKIQQEAVEEIIREFYPKALAEESLEPITYPKIDIKNFDEAQEFVFSASFEIHPKVSISKYEGLKVVKEILEIKDESVDKILEDLRVGKAKAEPILIERPIENGDIAVIDFVGQRNGVSFEGGTANNFELELGSGQFVPGFEDGVIGMTIGARRDIALKFPSNYGNKELASADVTFAVTLKEIKKKEVPKLDDEFAKSLGPFDSLTQLRNRVREDFEKEEIVRIKKELKSRLLKTFVDENPMDLPLSLVKEQEERLIEDASHRLQQQGFSPAQIEEYQAKWGKDFQESAAFIVHSSFLINQLADTLNLKAGESEVKAKIREYSETTGIDNARLEEYYGKKEVRGNLKFQLTEERVVDYLLEKANITEVEKSKITQEA